MGSLLPQQTSGVQVAWEVPALWSLDLDVLPRAKVSRHPGLRLFLTPVQAVKNKFKVTHLECMIMICVFSGFSCLCHMSMFHIQLCTYWSPCLPIPRVHLHPNKGTFDFRSAKQLPSSWHPKINIHKPCRFGRYTVQTNIFVLVYDRTSSYQQLHSLQWIVNANCSAWEKHPKETTAFLHLSLTSPGSKVQGLGYWKKNSKVHQPCWMHGQPVKTSSVFSQDPRASGTALTSSWFIAHQNGMAGLCKPFFTSKWYCWKLTRRKRPKKRLLSSKGWKSARMWHKAI